MNNYHPKRQKHYKYHSKSWSQLVREYTARVYYSGCWMVEHKEWTEKQRKKDMMNWFQYHDMSNANERRFAVRAVKYAKRHKWL